jgi:hypothetical protein
MITSDLISYIRDQIKNNISKDSIVSDLLKVGWQKRDIDEGFLNVESNFKSEVFLPEIKKEQPSIQTPEIKKNKIEPSKVWIPMNIPVKETASSLVHRSDKKEELTKTIDHKNTIDSLDHPLKKPEISVPQGEQVKSSLIVNLPKTAMLSSYANDLSLVSNFKKETIQIKKNKLSRWLIPVLIILVMSFGIVFASRYVNIKSLSFLIKKDPKILLLNNSKVLSSLESYKTETDIEISSPSFSSITNGLINGETISSLDKDSIAVKTLGVINKNENGIAFDNSITTKSSLLKDSVVIDVKSNGVDLFISALDLGKIINEGISESSIVKVNENQINLIAPLFSTDIESVLNKINIYKIFSSGMSSYINNETLGAYDEFINKVEIVEKGQESIKGIDTYHYSVNFDRELTKNLLNIISDNFTLNLSVPDKDKLSDILGSINVTSFDVWVGKGDNNIYQYSVVFDVPLSKVISYEDKSIGNNKVSISWKTTYYDFNVTNEIVIPQESISVVDFINIIKQTRIKNEVSSFAGMAMSLKNAEGVYGNKTNPKGDCINPKVGSLFSPTGHTKGSDSAIGSISELLNKILKITNGNGFCYSTPKAWSFTIPISNNYDTAFVPPDGYKSFFCVDSTGDIKDLTSPPIGVSCSNPVLQIKATN